MLKLFKLLPSLFTKVQTANTLSKKYCEDLIKLYINNSTSDLYIYNNDFQYVFGVSTNELIKDSTWDEIYLKIIQDYADTYNEVIAYQQEVLVYHKLWNLNNNLINSWISATNRNPFNILTSLTLLDSDVDYVFIDFKYFKSLKLYKGQTLTFPSSFEYSHKVNLRKHNCYLIFSQVSLSPSVYNV